jgi:hypothetical protein
VCEAIADVLDLGDNFEPKDLPAKVLEKLAEAKEGPAEQVRALDAKAAERGLKIEELTKERDAARKEVAALTFMLEGQGYHEERKDGGVYAALGKALEHARLGQAVRDLERQLARLEANPCPTMGFGFGPAETVRAVIAEAHEVLAEAPGTIGAQRETAGVLAVAMRLVKVHDGSLLVALLDEEERLRNRLDWMELHGLTWEEAKARLAKGELAGPKPARPIDAKEALRRAFAWMLLELRADAEEKRSAELPRPTAPWAEYPKRLAEVIKQLRELEERHVALCGSVGAAHGRIDQLEVRHDAMVRSVGDAHMRMDGLKAYVPPGWDDVVSIAGKPTDPMGLFHAAWCAAKGLPDYDKGSWSMAHASLVKAVQRVKPTSEPIDLRTLVHLAGQVEGVLRAAAWANSDGRVTLLAQVDGERYELPSLRWLAKSQERNGHPIDPHVVRVAKTFDECHRNAAARADVVMLVPKATDPRKS